MGQIKNIKLHIVTDIKAEKIELLVETCMTQMASQSDVGASNSCNMSETDQELHHLCALAGVKFDPQVFELIIDLLRLNVNPDTLLDVLRKMSTQREGSSTTRSSQISKKSQTSHKSQKTQ